MKIKSRLKKVKYRKLAKRVAAPIGIWVLYFKFPVIFFGGLALIVEFLVFLIYPQASVMSANANFKVAIGIDVFHPRAVVSDKFLSYSLDTSRVLGGNWWNPEGKVEVVGSSKTILPLNLQNQKLIDYASALAPAYMRLGGSEADKVMFDRVDAEVPKHKDVLILSSDRWSDIAAFASSSRADIFFTANAGPSVRQKNDNWQPDNLESLLAFSREQNINISAIELGNEPNGYWYNFGLSNRISPTQFAKDFFSFRSLVKSYYPNAKVGGAASMFWPLIGEAPSLVGSVEKNFIKSVGANADMYLWHYYPQQSDRCPIAVRRAEPELLLNPANLAEAAKWSNQIVAERNAVATSTQVWLGETGNAMCGGQKGISDTFESSLWWADELGLMAKSGQQVVVRQDLVGADYGLLNDDTFEPTPDYWTSLLWKKLMGETVLNTVSSFSEPYVRVYAHCTSGVSGYPKGSVTVLAINLEHEASGQIIWPQYLANQSAIAYTELGPALNSKNILINNHVPDLRSFSREIIKSSGQSGISDQVTFPPLSITFIVLPNARAEACL